MYDTPDELMREIIAGEDSFLDWKEVVFKGEQLRFVPKHSGDSDKALLELAKDLTCFANTEGGVIVFGVRKDGERVGIPEDRMEALQALIVNAAQNNVEPPLGHLLTFDRMMIPDSSGSPRLCLKLQVRKALHGVHAPTGRRPYWRISDHCHEMTLEQQARAFERRGLMLPFEERPVIGATLADIDAVRFKAYCEMRWGEGAELNGELLLRRMRNLKLLALDEAQQLRPTGLGLLLFSSTPDQWIAGACVDVVVYAGGQSDANLQRDAKTFRGPLIDQIERTLEYLRQSPFVPIAAEKGGLGRIDRPSYSLRALQEALVNSVVHRDYGLPSQVRVFVFDDRIEISNPGKLHNTLTPEDLFAGCQPVRRNQMLAGFLRDYTSPFTERAYMEARGEGFLGNGSGMRTGERSTTGRSEHRRRLQAGALLSRAGA